MTSKRDTANAPGEGARTRLADLLEPDGALQTVLEERNDALAGNLENELEQLNQIISQARTDIRGLGIGDISDEKIPRAGQELDEVVRATEDATNTIMGSAEEILNADTSDADAYQMLVTDEVMKIFEACSFQDITGQRVSKVVQTLEKIEERIGKISEAFGLAHHAESEPDERETRQNDLLLNGPALDGEGTQQDNIDAYFEQSEDANQDDIDALFN